MFKIFQTAQPASKHTITSLDNCGNPHLIEKIKNKTKLL